MRWIGQHIWPFKSRFRSDAIIEKDSSLYLGANEVLSQTGGNVTLANIAAVDADTISTLNTALTAGDLTSIVAGAGMTGSGLTGPIPTLNVIGGTGITVNADEIIITPDQETVTSVLNDTLSLGTSDHGWRWSNDYVGISCEVGGGEIFQILGGGFKPRVTNTLDLGTASLEFKDAYFDGTVTSDAFAGPLSGNATTATNLVASTSTAVQLGTIELGHASDTTIERAGSGDVRVEGNLMYRAGGTDVAIADGGTGANYVASLTAGTGLTSTGATSGKTIAHSLSVDADQPSIESIGTNGDTLDIHSNSISMVNNSTQMPQIGLICQRDDATGPGLAFAKQRASGGSTLAGADDDVMGNIDFWGYNDGTPAIKRYAKIIGITSDTTTGEEAGRLDLQVKAHGFAIPTTGLRLEGDTDIAGEVDVTIGFGAASITKIDGTLTMGSTPAMTNAGLLSVANQTGITGTGTVTSGTWNSAGTLTTASQPNITTLAGVTTIGATGVNTLISSDDVQFYNPVDNGNPIYSFGASNNERFTIYPIYDSGAQTLDKVSLNTSVASGTAHKGKFVFGVDDVHILTIDDDGLNFESGKALTGDVTGDLTGNADTATTAVTVTGATQAAITSIGTDGDTLAILADDINIINTTASKPQLTIHNRQAGIPGPVFRMIGDRGDSVAGQQYDSCGGLAFLGNDAGGNQTQFCSFGAEVDVATDGQESGKMTWHVASHDGELASAFTAVGGADEDVVDVTLGNTADSVVTIPGQLLAVNGGMGTRHYGTKIKILPSDFIQNEKGGSNKSHQFVSNSWSITGVRATSSTSGVSLFAFVAIPEGMRATHVHVKGLGSGADDDALGSPMNDDVVMRVWNYSLDTGVLSAPITAAGVVGTELDFTTFNSTATNCFAVELEIGDESGNNADVMYGGYVTIEPIP